MGCLALAGFIHMLTGIFGLAGFVMKYVGPITVIPTVLLIGLVEL
jgi:nucleobase transporter 1/2